MKKVPIPGFKLRKHFSVYFKLYQRLNYPFGKAFESRKVKTMSLEILEAYLENRLPNWQISYYLPFAEAERRNKMYKK